MFWATRRSRRVNTCPEKMLSETSKQSKPNDYPDDDLSRLQQLIAWTRQQQQLLKHNYVMCNTITHASTICHM